jgi:hypothetical protein
MSQPEHRILNVGDHKVENSQGMLPSANLIQFHHPRAQLDVAPGSAPRQTAQILEGKPGYADSSGPLFSMYCKMAEEDKKVIETWLKWVDKVVILVRTIFSFLIISIPLTRQINITDGLVLYIRGCITYRDSSGPQAKPAGYRQLLS